MAIDPIAVWAKMNLKTWPERYWMLALADSDVWTAARFAVASEGKYSCMIRDQGCVSLIIEESALARIEAEAIVLNRFGPFKVVSTDAELPFDVIGFLKPVLEVLNRHGIKAGPQCGADFDHLFIYEKDITEALRLLNEFIASAKDAAGID